MSRGVFCVVYVVFLGWMLVVREGRAVYRLSNIGLFLLVCCFF